MISYGNGEAPLMVIVTSFCVLWSYGGNSWAKCWFHMGISEALLMVIVMILVFSGPMMGIQEWDELVLSMNGTSCIISQLWSIFHTCWHMQLIIHDVVSWLRILDVVNELLWIICIPNECARFYEWVWDICVVDCVFVVWFSTLAFFSLFILNVFSHPFVSCCPPWTSCK